VTPKLFEAAPRPNMNVEAEAKALRLRMYILCSECARLIDLAGCRAQQRQVEGADLFRHSGTLTKNTRLARGSRHQRFVRSGPRRRFGPSDEA